MRLPVRPRLRPVYVERTGFLRGRQNSRVSSFSSSSFRESLGGNFRVSTVFTALLVLGSGATAFGLYVTSLVVHSSELAKYSTLVTDISSIRRSCNGRPNCATTSVLESKPKIKVTLP